MPTIYDYLDYREFLSDYYKEQKQRMPFFSYRLIGQSVGMDSSYVVRVLQGILHISDKRIEAFQKVCKLKGQEAVYFATLVHFNKAKTELQRKLYFDKLFKISKVKTAALSVHQFEFFSKWYYSAIWALIQIKPREPDFEMLGALCEPPIPAEKARDAISLLLTLTLIARNENGLLVVTDNHLTTGEKWTSKAVSDYQHEMIRLAGTALTAIDKKHRDVSTVTVTIPESCFEQFRAMVTGFRKSLISLAHDLPEPDRAYQINIQLFPITKTGGDTA